MTAHARAPDTRARAERAADSAPDASWGGFYLAGGISALAYILVGLIVPFVLFTTTPYHALQISSADTLAFIADHRLWYFTLQTTVLVSSIFAIIAFAALFLALERADKSLAALGAIIGVTCQILFLAYYPVLLGLIDLSDKYAAAPASDASAIATAAMPLIAQNNAFNPMYEGMFAVGILFLSLAMLRGIFPRAIAYLGIATAVSAFLALSLFGVVGVSYFWWWLLFVFWFVAAGWKLIRLGTASPFERSGRASFPG
ncbi:MAG: hypothetical protein P8Y02_00155 [Deinococcales bacterium]